MFAFSLCTQTKTGLKMKGTTYREAVLRFHVCLRISSCQSLIRKGTASAAGFKEKSVNVAKNLAEYINMDDAGHFKYGLGFITSHVSHVMFMS